jgi:hypothetical protein
MAGTAEEAVWELVERPTVPVATTTSPPWWSTLPRAVSDRSSPRGRHASSVPPPPSGPGLTRSSRPRSCGSGPDGHHGEPVGDGRVDAQVDQLPHRCHPFGSVHPIRAFAPAPPAAAPTGGAGDGVRDGRDLPPRAGAGRPAALVAGAGCGGGDRGPRLAQPGGAHRPPPLSQRHVPGGVAGAAAARPAVGGTAPHQGVRGQRVPSVDRGRPCLHPAQLPAGRGRQGDVRRLPGGVPGRSGPALSGARRRIGPGGRPRAPAAGAAGDGVGGQPRCAGVPARPRGVAVVVLGVRGAALRRHRSGRLPDRGSGADRDGGAGIVAAVRPRPTDGSTAWLRPFSDFDDAGYQIAQGVFALGTGSLSGSGPGWASGPDPQRQHRLHLRGGGRGVRVRRLGGGAVCLCPHRRRRVRHRPPGPGPVSQAAGGGSGVHAFGIQVFLIIGGVLRVVPLTGITLPFMSYGGSSLLGNFLVLALLARVSHEEAG